MSSLDTIDRIDSSWRETISQRPQCQRLLTEFVERHGVKPFKKRGRNVLMLFRQGGAGSKRAKEVFGRYYNGFVFDHGELWGRDRTPLFLIGHPYQITDEGRKTLDAIRGLGLVVSDYHPSWYGYGTVQVRVFHDPTVAAMTGQTL